MSNFRTISVTIAVVLIGLSASAQEKRVRHSDLPSAVEKTVTAQSKGATIRGFSTEVEKGETHYEAELTISGHKKDILINSQGGILEVEEQVALDSLPTAVKTGLQVKAGKGKVIEVESITKQDKLVAYEAQVRTGTKMTEVQVDPEGKSLDHEE